MSMTTPPNSRPSYTLTQAATLAGVSRSTIRRRREAGDFPNALKNKDAQWMIPLTDLLAAGLGPASSERVHDQAQAEHPGSVTAPVVLTGLGQAAREQADRDRSELEARLIQAEKELGIERAKREGLENHLADAKANINDLRQAMLMLDMGPGKSGPIALGSSEPKPADPPATPPAEPVKKRWWQL